MSQMTCNGLKREKNTLLRYPNSVGLSIFRPGISRYRYDGASLTFFAGNIFHRSPLQFGKFVDVPIVYQRQKTILAYLYCLPRYSKPNMAKYRDSSPHPQISNPHISVKNFQIFLKFCPALGGHVYSCLKM